jgi:hypothetical protein
MILPMSTSPAPPDHPSHHSGPGYASAPPPPELAFDDGLSEHFVHWLNYVPEAHRNLDAAADERAEAVMARHVASCRKHPFEALFVAHRHLGNASPEVQLQALLLASEALWWLHHYADAQLAAETALRAHPRSTQALWRLSVAQYKAGHFEEAERNLDSLLATVNTFAPAWSLRGQTKVWQTPDKPSAGGSDFEAANELDGTWPVPVRLSNADFQKLVDGAVLESMADMRGAFQQPVAEVEMLPGIPAVARGDDPDIRCSFFNPTYVGTRGPLSMLGGDFAAGARRDIAPGARIVLYQRNIENLCSDPALLSQEVTKSFAEALAGSMRIDATAVQGAPEVHAEDADRPAADQP